MASRKDQKEQARAARLAKEQEETARKQRRRRLEIFGAITAVAVAAIVVVIVVSISGGGSGGGTGLQHGPKLTATYNTVNAEISGIPENGTTIGDPKAKVTLTYWGDLQCPVCMEFTTGEAGGGLPQFIQTDVRNGTAKVRYESLCTATCSSSDPTGGTSVFNTQQSAAYAAGKQNLLWYYIELFYREQGTEDSGYATKSFIDGIGEQIPKLHLKTWQAEIGSKSLVAEVNADQNSGVNKYGFDATPSFIISGPKGTSSLGSGVLTYSELVAAVKSVS